MMGKNDEGNWTVNKKVFGVPQSTLEGAIQQLTTKPRGWPIKPTTCVMTDGSKEPAEKIFKAVGGGGGGGGGEGGKPLWLHGKTAKSKADTLLLGGGGKQGRFFVRPHPNQTDAFIVSIMFKGKPTHHKSEKGEDGFFVINGKQLGPKATTIEQLVAALATKPKGWPVNFAEIVKPDGSSVPFSSASGGGGGKPEKKNKAIPAAPSGGGSGGGKGPMWLHGTISKDKADSLLDKATDGDFTTGTFLFRKRAGGKPGFVLSVRRTRQKKQLQSNSSFNRLSLFLPLILSSSATHAQTRIRTHVNVHAHVAANQSICA